jgi:hypothetical protein
VQPKHGQELQKVGDANEPIQIHVVHAGVLHARDGRAECATSVVEGGFRNEIEGDGIHASWDAPIIAHAIAIRIGLAIAATHTNCIELVAQTIAITPWDVETATWIDGTQPIALPARIEHPHAVVHIVTDAIAICICRTIPSTIPRHVRQGSLAITCASRNLFTPTGKHGARTIAHATRIHHPNARIHLITQIIPIDVFCAWRRRWRNGQQPDVLKVEIRFSKYLHVGLA